MKLKQFMRLLLPSVYTLLFAYYLIASLFVGIVPLLTVCLYIVYVVGFLANGIHVVLLLLGRTPAEDNPLLSVCSFVNFLGTLCLIGNVIMILW